MISHEPYQHQPSIIDNNIKIWILHGKIHRPNNLPAVEFSNGHSQYYFLGKLHRSNGPAVISDNKEWWVHGVELPIWVPKIEDNNIYGFVNKSVIYRTIIEIDYSYGVLLYNLFRQ